MRTYSCHIIHILFVDRHFGISDSRVTNVPRVLSWCSSQPTRTFSGKKNYVNPKHRSVESRKRKRRTSGPFGNIYSDWETDLPLDKRRFFFSKNLCFTWQQLICYRRCNSIAWHPQCKGTPPFEGGNVSALQCLMLDAWWWVWLEIRSHFCEVQSEIFISTWFNETNPQYLIPFGCI